MKKELLKVLASYGVLGTSVTLLSLGASGGISGVFVVFGSIGSVVALPACYKTTRQFAEEFRRGYSVLEQRIRPPQLTRNVNAVHNLNAVDGASNVEWKNGKKVNLLYFLNSLKSQVQSFIDDNGDQSKPPNSPDVIQIISDLMKDENIKNAGEMENHFSVLSEINKGLVGIKEHDQGKKIVEQLCRQKLHNASLSTVPGVDLLPVNIKQIFSQTPQPQHQAVAVPHESEVLSAGEDEDRPLLPAEQSPPPRKATSVRESARLELEGARSLFEEHTV